MLSNIFHFLRAKRREITTGIFILFVSGLGIYYLFFEGRNQNTNNGEPTPTPQPQISSLNENRESTSISQNNYVFKQIPYYMYQVRTKNGVLGYGWSNNRLLYANGDGIFEARIEVPLVNEKLSYANFNQNGKAILRTRSGNWYIFENGQDLQLVQNLGTTPQLNQDGSTILSMRETNLIVTTVSNNRTIEIELPGNGISFVTSGSSPFVLTLSENGNGRTLGLVSINDAKVIDQLNLSSNSSVFGISPNASRLLFKSDLDVIIRSRYSGEKDIRYQVSDNADYQGYWINDNQAVLIERRPKGSSYQVGQLYLLDAREEKKEFLVDDKQMIGKINPEVPLYSDSQNRAVGIAENNGTLWLVSLVPGKLANYSRNTGLELFESNFQEGMFSDNH